MLCFIAVTRRGQTTPLMFHEGYICLVYIFLNQFWQMSFLCSPVYFNLEVVRYGRLNIFLLSPRNLLNHTVILKSVSLVYFFQFFFRKANNLET